MKRVLLAVTVFLLAAPVYAAWWHHIFPNPWVFNR